MTASPHVTLALAGQPNVGKSTVFNISTGLNQHVGNWPGKTVELKTGKLVHHGVAVDIIDLPGAYSLTAASPEESVTRDYIIRDQPDVVVVIINAASLERNLYLVSELLALPTPVVIGLNMIDVAKQEGFEVEPNILAAAIGVPVVPMIASKGQGVRELLDAALHVAIEGPEREPNRPEIRRDHAEVLGAIEELIAEHVPSPYPVDWAALKLIEGDQEVTRLIREHAPKSTWDIVAAILLKHEDAILAVAGGRYSWIRRMTRAALKRPRGGRITVTHRLDSVATHPFWGLLLLGVVLAITFGLTYSVGGPLQQWLAEVVVGGMSSGLGRLLSRAPLWVSGLVVQGVIGGVGTVLTFIPILAVFFAAMALLEDVGYMARAAYVMDRFMHAFGLHGKSFMPLFLGFGCNVPAIMGARIIESRKSRLLTIMLAPLVPCTARLAVLTVLVPVFFPDHATLVSWLLTGLPLVVLALTGILANKVIFHGEQAAFIMEMPLYHVPRLKNIAITVWQRVVAFIRKATSVILFVSVAIWALSTLPFGEIESSYLAAIGRTMAPIGQLMGLGWRPLVAMLTSFVAKENAVATLGVLYGVGEDPAALAQMLSASMSQASGLAFLVAEMLFIPCVAALAVIRQETNSWRWVLVEIAFLTVITVIGSTATYQIASLVV